jgi:hypothetical protein
MTTDLFRIETLKYTKIDGEWRAAEWSGHGSSSVHAYTWLCV